MALAALGVARRRGGPLRVLAISLAGLLWLAEPAFADEPVRPKTSSEAAARVEELWAKRDLDGIATLARQGAPDPWFVTNRLCRARAFDAAEAFAERTLEHARDALRTYVGVQKGVEVDEARQKAFDASGTRGISPHEVLEALDGVATGPEDVTSVVIGVRRGGALKALGKGREAEAVFDQASKTAEAIGWWRMATLTRADVGILALSRHDYRSAVLAHEKQVELAERWGSDEHLARALTGLAGCFSGLGRHAEALEFLRKALPLAKGVPLLEEGITANMGGSLWRLGLYPEAIERMEDALAQAKARGDTRAVAMGLGNLGNVYFSQGSYAKALECQERSLAMREAVGDRHGQALALGNIANVLSRLGRFEEALEYQGRSLVLMDELGDKRGVARAHHNIGIIHTKRSDPEKARAELEQATALYEALGNEGDLAGALVDLGTAYRGSGRSEQAEALYERGLEITTRLGLDAWRATALSNLGFCRLDRGDPAGALGYFTRAHALAAEIGDVHSEITELTRMAHSLNKLGRPKEALTHAENAVERLPLVLQGLSDASTRIFRDGISNIFTEGVTAAMALRDPAALCFFSEHGRAMTLLDALGGRRELARYGIPDALREDEQRAREAIGEARKALGAARRTGRYKQLRQARTAFEDAQDGLLEVVRRIQRESKAGARIAYPEVAPLGAIQQVLEKGEAFVAYAITQSRGTALVATRDQARVVDFGGAEAMHVPVRALALDDPGSDLKEGLERARAAVVGPLGLGKEITRVVVSPHGELGTVPFALLFPDKTVTYAPSGTLLAWLRRRPAPGGTDVLAVGDPAYAPARRLVRLPSSGAEAKAVGDVVLLGEEATEGAIRKALQSKPAWRALHLACHGLIDPKRAAFSSLALAEGGGDDGDLTMLEVTRMDVPADLVVLSACESAKGELYRAEGTVGFTGAFMVAGAPQVLCSLWKVDDAATRALMVAFYELWTPETSAASALRQAQERVRSQQKWAHPYYWAAWVLWGSSGRSR